LSIEARTLLTHPGFNDYVQSALNGRHAPPQYTDNDHWIDIILDEAGSDQAAFNLFHELWAAFIQACSNREDLF
jgi:hypothetical protein